MAILEIESVFLEQAQYLCRGGELLPGGAEALAKKLQKAAETQTPLRVKLGLDPTRPDLHLGHTVVMRKLKAFQELGHEIILIIGDATAMIGDPSGRSQTRPPLTEEEVKANAETYLAQAEKVIDVAKAQVVRNSEWLSPMQLAELLKLASRVTVAQMMVRDDFAKRYAENKPISIHEFFYPLMQAYDSVVVRADIELGGTDQRFNNLLGRDIQLAYGIRDPQLVLLLPLLEGTDGKLKMSKSYPENCINLTDTPEMMFGKLMSIPDSLILRYMELLTTATQEIVTQYDQGLRDGQLNPRDVKAEMAKWILSQYHGVEAADEAEQNFIKRFREGQIPEDMPEVSLAAGEAHNLPALMADHGLAPSRGEARRLIAGGGVRLEGEKVPIPAGGVEATVTGQPNTDQILQVGKRKFLRLKFS